MLTTIIISCLIASAVNKERYLSSDCEDNDNFSLYNIYHNTELSCKVSNW